MSAKFQNENYFCYVARMQTLFWLSKNGALKLKLKLKTKTKTKFHFSRMRIKSKQQSKSTRYLENIIFLGLSKFLLFDLNSSTSITTVFEFSYCVY